MSTCVFCIIIIIKVHWKLEPFLRDGKPYCEKDYQAEFGVTCAGCGGYIIGKVLQVSKLVIPRI